jgi:hypothetical protein
MRLFLQKDLVGFFNLLYKHYFCEILQDSKFCGVMIAIFPTFFSRFKKYLRIRLIIKTLSYKIQFAKIEDASKKGTISATLEN